MKKLLLSVITAAIFQSLSAQYCGNSGPLQCTVSGTVTQPGLSPRTDSLPPFYNGMASTTVIQFRNFNVVYFGGNAFTVQSLRLDTISNLPSGLCWASDRADNTYLNSQDGCIKVNGTPCDLTGQYKLHIIASVTTSAPFVITAQVDAANYGLPYFVRLNNTGDVLTPVDTLSQVPFVPYGGACPPVLTLGNDQTVCTGSTVTLNPTVTGGQQPLTYSWTSTGDTLSCTSCSTPSITLTQNSTIVVVANDAYNHTTTDTVVYNVTGSGGVFQIAANGPTTFCRGGSLKLHAVQNATFTNQWQRNGANISGATDSVLVITDSSGVYSVVYSNGGCTALANTISVTVNDVPSVTVTPPGPVNVCQGGSATLQANATAGVTYVWQRNGNSLGGATNPTYSTIFAGTYSVVVTNSVNCSDTGNAVVVAVHPLPTVTLSGNADTVCSASSPITLTGGSPSGGVYSGSGVSGGSFNPATAGVGAHTISYTYTDSNNCSASVNEPIVVRVCTGINSIEQNFKMLLYPNPVNGRLTVQSEAFKSLPFTLFILDAAGKEISLNYQRQGESLVVNTNSLPIGVYNLILKVAGEEITRKFIKAE